jgi:hypothetical protein
LNAKRFKKINKNMEQSDKNPSAGAAQADKTAILVNILRTINENAVAALRLLDSGAASIGADAVPPAAVLPPLPVGGLGAVGTIIEGVFNGQAMVGSDGREYPVPANYASKSKLVEGDLMKLTMSPTGAFIFKQIGPVERERLVGTLTHARDLDEYAVVAGDKKYKVLKASITYFRGADGDEAAIFVPRHSPSKWAAVDNIIKRTVDLSSNL